MSAKTMLEWQVFEQEEEWENFQAVQTHLEAEGKMRRVSLPRLHMADVVWIPTLVALVVGVTFSQQLWHDYQDSFAYVQEEVQYAIELDNAALHHSSVTLVDEPVDGEARESWMQVLARIQHQPGQDARDESQASTVEVLHGERQGDVVMVQLLVSDPDLSWPPAPYRETRFYWQSEGQWQRTEPVASFWGKQETLETGRFRFEFHERDADTVAAAANQMEVAYVGLRSDLGLPLDHSEKFSIAVVPERPPGPQPLRNTRRFTDDKRLTVPSPMLLPMPQHHPETSVLAHQVAAALVEHQVAGAHHFFGVGLNWRYVVEGLKWWLATEYASLPIVRRQAREDLLEEQLERGEELRLTELMVIRTRHSMDTINHSVLDPTNYNVLDPTNYNVLDPGSAVVLAEQLIDFVVVAYGRDRLPDLVKGMGLHPTWETLTPAVFGVPAHEFEAEWQAYLAATHLRSNSNAEAEK